MQLIPNFTFTFMHLADAFIQSDLQYIQVIHFLSVHVFLGIEPTTFALLTQCSNHRSTVAQWFLILRLEVLQVEMHRLQFSWLISYFLEV